MSSYSPSQIPRSLLSCEPSHLFIGPVHVHATNTAATRGDVSPEDLRLNDRTNAFLLPVVIQCHCITEVVGHKRGDGPVKAHIADVVTVGDEQGGIVLIGACNFEWQNFDTKLDMGKPQLYLQVGGVGTCLWIEEKLNCLFQKVSRIESLRSVLYHISQNAYK